MVSLIYGILSDDVTREPFMRPTKDAPCFQHYYAAAYVHFGRDQYPFLSLSSRAAHRLIEMFLYRWLVRLPSPLTSIEAAYLL